LAPKHLLPPIVSSGEKPPNVSKEKTRAVRAALLGTVPVPYLASEFCGWEGELEGRVEVMLLLMAPMDDLPLPHHQEPGVPCSAHAAGHPT